MKTSILILIIIIIVIFVIILLKNKKEGYDPFYYEPAAEICIGTTTDGQFWISDCNDTGFPPPPENADFSKKVQYYSYGFGSRKYLKQSSNVDYRPC